MQTKMLIAGERVAGLGEKLAVVSPATGEVLTHIAEASTEQVAAAVAAAEAAFGSWRATAPKERSERLLTLADKILAHGTELAMLESANCGKPYAAVLADEIPAIADVFRYLSHIHN